jgi:DNA-directed RNA polymerase subunit K/omega
MDFKKIKTETTAVTRQKDKFYEQTGNIYETVVVLSKRANQIGAVLKQELDQKVSEFTSSTDNLEEVFENREQIEIAKYYEGLPKPTLLAIHEFLNKEIYIRNPHKEVATEF